MERSLTFFNLILETHRSADQTALETLKLQRILMPVFLWSLRTEKYTATTNDAIAIANDATAK